MTTCKTWTVVRGSCHSNCTCLQQWSSTLHTAGTTIVRNIRRARPCTNRSRRRRCKREGEDTTKFTLEQDDEGPVREPHMAAGIDYVYVCNCVRSAVGIVHIQVALGRKEGFHHDLEQKSDLIWKRKHMWEIQARVNLQGQVKVQERGRDTGVRPRYRGKPRHMDRSKYSGKPRQG